MDLRQEIRKIIQEAFGVVVPIDDVVESLSKIVQKELNSNVNVFREENYVSTLNVARNMNKDFLKKTLIRTIIIRLFIYKNKENINPNTLQGSFKKDETDRFSENDQIIYSVTADINIINWDYETNLLKQIKSILSHELHHAYDFVHRDNKKSQTKIFSYVGNKMRLNQPIINNKYFNEFLSAFYLNMPEEINARIHQAYTNIKAYKNNPFKDIMKRLGKLTTFKDFTKLYNYNPDALLKNTTNEEQTTFISEFSKALEEKKDYYKLEDTDINYPKDPSDFFKFWEKQFKANATKARIKAIKLAERIKIVNPPSLKNTNSKKSSYNFEEDEINNLLGEIKETQLSDVYYLIDECADIVLGSDFLF